MNAQPQSTAVIDQLPDEKPGRLIYPPAFAMALHDRATNELSRLVKSKADLSKYDVSDLIEKLCVVTQFLSDQDNEHYLRSAEHIMLDEAISELLWFVTDMGENWDSLAE